MLYKKKRDKDIVFVKGKLLKFYFIHLYFLEGYIMFYLLLFSIMGSFVIAGQNTSYDNFGTNRNNIVTLGSVHIGIGDVHILPDGHLICLKEDFAEDTNLYKIDREGNVVNQLTLSGLYSRNAGIIRNHIFWGPDFFVIPVYDTKNQGYLYCYDYNFQPIRKFGGSNTGRVTVPMLPMSVISDDQYYYLGGRRWTNGRPAIIRFYADPKNDNFGRQDTTFNHPLNTTAFQSLGTSSICSMLKIEDVIIFQTTTHIIVTPASNPTTILQQIPLQTLTPFIYSNFIQAVSFLFPYDSKSFFIAAGSAVYKYVYNSNSRTIELDRSFAGTGKFNFADNNPAFFTGAEWYPAYSLNMLGNHLYVGGEFGGPNGLRYPWVACLDISDMSNPVPANSFFSQGFLKPSWLQASVSGARRIIPISNSPLELILVTRNFLKRINNDSSWSLYSEFNNLKSASIVDSFNAYSDFGSFFEKDDVFVEGEAINGLAAQPNLDLIVTSSNYIYRFDVQGKLIRSVYVLNNSPKWFGYYGPNVIVLPDNGYTHAFSQAGIHFFDYFLNPITSLGSEGSTLLNDPNYDLEFLSVVQVGQYYYASGYAFKSNTSTYHPLLARFNVQDGRIDNTFGTIQTPGYYIYTNIAGRFLQMIPLKDFLVCIDDSNNGYALSYANFTAPLLPMPLASQEKNMNVITYDTRTFFTVSEARIQKLTEQFTLDQSFNGTGELVFDINTIRKIFPNNIIEDFSLTDVLCKREKMFVLGNCTFTENVYSQHPFIVCYDISQLAKPILETAFFTNGFCPVLWRQNSVLGAQGIFMTDEERPSLFLFGDGFIKNKLFNSEFERKNIFNKSLQDVIQYQDYVNNPIPFLS